MVVNNTVIYDCYYYCFYNFKTNKVKKNVKTYLIRQYNIQIFSIIVFLKYKKTNKSTQTNKKVMSINLKQQLSD